jgi:hypothetical protein
MSNHIKSFIKHLIEENYSAANIDLEKAVFAQIKTRIATNLKNKK